MNLGVSRLVDPQTARASRASQGRLTHIYFSVVQRKVVSPNDFFDLGAIAERLAAFEARYNAAARPFDWKFDRDDLDELLARTAAHEQGAPLPLAAPA